MVASVALAHTNLFEDSKFQITNFSATSRHLRSCKWLLTKLKTCINCRCHIVAPEF